MVELNEEHIQLIRDWGRIAKKHSHWKHFTLDTNRIDEIRTDVDEFIQNPTEGKFREFWGKLHSSSQGGNETNIYSKWIGLKGNISGIASFMRELRDAPFFIEGWKKEMGAKNTLTELFGTLNIERFPIVNSCTMNALNFFQIHVPKTYEKQVEVIDEFKDEYLSILDGSATKGTDHEVPLLVEIDQLFNFIDKVKQDDIFRIDDEKIGKFSNKILDLRIKNHLEANQDIVNQIISSYPNSVLINLNNQEETRFILHF